MCMSVLPPCAHLHPHRPEEGVMSISQNWCYRELLTTMWVLGTERGPFGRTAEPSPHEESVVLVKHELSLHEENVVLVKHVLAHLLQIFALVFFCCGGGFFLVFVFVFLFCFFETVSQCTPDYPGTYSVDQGGLELGPACLCLWCTGTTGMHHQSPASPPNLTVLIFFLFF